jgi:hypothetical protein
MTRANPPDRTNLFVLALLAVAGFALLVIGWLRYANVI